MLRTETECSHELQNSKNVFLIKKHPKDSPTSSAKEVVATTSFTTKESKIH